MKSSASPAWQRHVYFLGGFDPKGAAHYYALFKSEAQKQSAVNGMSIRVGSRHRTSNGNSFWTINTEMPDARYCETTYEFVRWDDLVRKHWQRSTWRLILDVAWMYMRILKVGVALEIWKISKKQLIGLVLPLLLWSVSLALGVLLAVSMYVAMKDNGTGLALVSAFSISASVLFLATWIESRLNTSLLLRIFSFVSKYAHGKLPDLDTRLDETAKHLRAKLSLNAVDEILLVGFSVGSILAISVMARALGEKQKDLKLWHPTVSLLTLGNCIPALGLWPQASGFREELCQLATNKNLTWMDYSSPTDWGSFAMIDPVAACNVSLISSDQTNPVMRSPRFHTALSSATYTNLRRNKQRMHMQYLMAGQFLSEYDYFAISTGGHRLGKSTASI